MKVFLGIIIGVSVSFLSGLVLSKYFISSYQIGSPYNFLLDSSVVKGRNNIDLKAIVTEFKNSNNELQLRIASIEKRFDDATTFCGIIVTLLLAISITSLVRADEQVKKYFRDKHASIEKEMQTKLETASLKLNQIETISDSIQLMERELANKTKIKGIIT